MKLENSSLRIGAKEPIACYMGDKLVWAPDYVRNGLIDLWTNFSANGVQQGLLNHKDMTITNCTFDSGTAVTKGQNGSYMLVDDCKTKSIVIIGYAEDRNGFVISTDTDTNTGFRWYLGGERRSDYYTKDYADVTCDEIVDNSMHVCTASKDSDSTLTRAYIGCNSPTSYPAKLHVKALMLYSVALSKDDSIKIAKWLNNG